MAVTEINSTNKDYIQLRLDGLHRSRETEQALQVQRPNLTRFNVKDLCTLGQKQRLNIVYAAVKLPIQITVRHRNIHDCCKPMKTPTGYKASWNTT